MNIGILSMQEVRNYGSFLQAFALRSMLEALGHRCSFVNIVPGERLESRTPDWLRKASLLSERLRGGHFAERLKNMCLFHARFAREFLPELGVGKGGEAAGHLDAVVIGSDEVFNCTQDTWFGFSRQLFGEGLDADKVITYAASFGSTTLPMLERRGIKDVVAGLLGKLDKISVRDMNSYETVRALTGESPEMHVDPVLAFDYAGQLRALPRREGKGYMVVYTYPGRISDPGEVAAIRAYAGTNGLDLVSVGHYFPWCDATVVPHPFKVLSYFRHAACVVTDTFHGAVFSIKYNRPFCAIVRDTNSQKLAHLLGQFGLTGRIAAAGRDIPSLLERPVDYSPVNAAIRRERERSLDYLKKNLD